MSTKIQINSLAALERLIGDDPDVEVEVRNNVIKEFAKRLRPMMGTLIEKEMQDNLLETDYGFKNSLTLTKTAKQLVKNAVQIEQKRIIVEAVQTELGKIDVDGLVRTCAEQLSETVVRDAVRKKMEQVVAKLS